MKKISKRLLSLMLAAIMAMPTLFALPSAASAEEQVFDGNLVARYLVDSNITDNKALDAYDLEAMRNNSTGSASDFSYDGYSVKFPGGSNRPYLRAPLSGLLSTVDFNDGFTITFNGKRANDSWQRYFEISSGKLENGNSTGQMWQDGGPANTFFFTGRVESNNNGWGRVKYNGSESSSIINLGDDGNWHFWAITVKKGSIAVFRDGVHAGTISDSNMICDDWYNTVKAGYLCLGASSWVDDSFSGNIKDFRIYNKGFTETDVNALLKPNVVYNSRIDFRNSASYTSSISNKVATITSTDGGNKTLKGERGDGMVITTSNAFSDGNYWPYNDLWDGECLTYYTNSSPNTVFQSGKDFRVMFHMGFRANDKVDSDPYIVMFNYEGSTPIGLRRNGTLAFNNTGDNDRKTYGTQVTPYNLNSGGDENKKEEYAKWFDFQYDYETNTLTYSLWSDAGNINGTYSYRLSDYGVNLDPGAITSVCIGNVLYGRYAQCRFLEWYFYEPTVTSDIKTAIQNITVKSLSEKSTGIVFNGGSAGKVTQNVVYPDASGFVDSSYWNNDLSGNSNTRMQSKVMAPASVMAFLYSGNKNVVKIPVIAQNNKNGGTCKGYIVNWLTTNGDDWGLTNDRWYQCSSYNNWNQTASGDVNDTTIISTDTSHDPDYLGNKSGGTGSSITLSNYIYYKGNGISNTNYITKLPNPTFNVSFDGRGDWWGGSGKWTNKTINGMPLANNDVSIYAINYSLWQNFINNTVNSSNFQSTLTDVINNEWKYTEDSINNLYSILIKILRFDINKQAFNIGAGWEALGSEMTALQNEFNDYKNPTKKVFNVSFTNFAGSRVNLKKITAGNTLGSLPSNTVSVYTSNNHHNAYRWDGINSGTVVHDSVAYSETEYEESCNHDIAKPHTAATSELNGYIDYACSACSHIDENNRVWDEQSWSLYNAKQSQYLETTNDQKYDSTYTTTSKNAYANAYSTNSLNTGDQSIPQSKINTAATNIGVAYEALDPLADMTYFDAEYDKANTFLVNLDGKAAEYTANSMQTLINAMKATNVETYAKANAAARADYGHSVQTNAETLANNIKTAMAGLEKVEAVAPQSVDTSALEAALVKINNIDPDAYNVESGSISSAMAGVNAVLSSDETQKDYNGATINVLNGTINQQNVEDATNAILTALTVSTKKYGIFKNEGSADFGITAKNGEYKNNQATYGTTLVCDAGDAETAWYLEIQTGSMHKELAYAGAGQRFQTKVLGTTTIKAVRKNENKKVRIVRQYGSEEVTGRSPVQVVDYVAVGEDYVLPAAPAIAYYDFEGYYIGETKYNTGESVSISNDTEIIAKYTANEGADCAINATNYSATVKYNDKVELTGTDETYAWVEEADSTGTHFRPFYIGKNVSFFASESTNLRAVSKSEFDAFKFSLPAVNLRKSGVYVVGGKTTFNAQIVPGNANVQEYGILIAAPYGSSPASSIDPTQVVIENSGKHADEGYQILRAKSTKLVGANQFTIGVNGIPSGYVYRGYLIYADADGTLHNVYSEAMR